MGIWLFSLFSHFGHWIWIMDGWINWDNSRGKHIMAKTALSASARWANIFSDFRCFQVQTTFYCSVIVNGEGRANNWLFTEWMADGCLFWCGVQIAIIIEQKGVCLNGTKRQPKVHYTVIFFSFWTLQFIRFSFSRFFSCQNDHTSHSEVRVRPIK